MASEASQAHGMSSDADLIAASLEDPCAFAVIFDRHYDAIGRFLTRRIGRALAEELSSETFIRAFAQRDHYELEHRNAAPWLYGIATNLLRKHAREEDRRRRAYARAVRPEVTSDEGDEAEARIDAQARGPAVAAALARLHPADRDTLLLFALADLDYESISRATNVPVGTVRSRLHRARRCISVELGLGRQTSKLGNIMTERNPA